MRTRALATLAVLLFFVIGPAGADDTAPLEVRVEWRAPTTGSLVVLWELQIRVKHGPPEVFDPILIPVDEDDPDAGAPHGSLQQFTLPAGLLSRDVVYEGRIRGFDLQDRAGPWTPWTEAWFATPDPEDDSESP